MNNDNKNNNQNNNFNNNPNNNSNNQTNRPNPPQNDLPVSTASFKEVNKNNKNRPPEDRNRNIMRIIGIILAVIVILAVFGLIPGTKKQTKDEQKAVAPESTEVVDGCTPGDLFSATTGKPCPQPQDNSNAEPTSAPNKSSTTPNSATAVVSSSASSSYEKTLADYAGKLIAFDAQCKATPSTLSVNSGTRVLVANNSKNSATLAVGNLRSEKLDGFHYFTVTLKDKGQVAVICNGQATATFNVQ